MCGIAGVIAWDEKYRVSPQLLGEMSSRIAHRGPDGEGTYFSTPAPITPDRPQIALAHRRLAILDPDPRANQPFTDHAGRWIVFNGEIYNFRDLRSQLSHLQPDYAWRTAGDTEVLLIAYNQWGEKCVDHLNGMFALAVWDEPQKTLFLARDRMGQKPLYLACMHDGTGSFSPNRLDRNPEAGKLSAIAFASEIAAIGCVPWALRRIRPVAVTEYLRLGYVPSPLSIHEGIGQMAAGETLLIGRDFSRQTHYFDAATGAHGSAALADPRLARGGDPVVVVRNLLQQAVARQLVSDVPLGCFLSGGVDSSIVAACMRASSPKEQEVLTFSIGFDDARYDETGFAAAVAAHLGTRHHTFTVRPDAAADLPKLAAVFGQPFGDSSALPTHYLARETRTHVKVALSGDGGDELFGGYDRYRAMFLSARIQSAGGALPWRVLAPFLRRIASGHPKSRRHRFKRFADAMGLAPAKRYAQYVALFSETMIAELLADGHDAATPMLESRYGVLSASCDEVQAALAVDREMYLPDDLLTKVDRASMLHALEVRAPFMDHELVQFAAGLTTNQLLQAGPKRMLREAFAADLPAWVFKRKKMGFAVPIGEWFRGALRSMLHDHLFAGDSFAATHFNRPFLEKLVLDHESRQNDHSQRLYALLMLEMWWKLNRIA